MNMINYTGCKILNSLKNRVSPEKAQYIFLRFQDDMGGGAIAECRKTLRHYVPPHLHFVTEAWSQGSLGSPVPFAPYMDCKAIDEKFYIL